MTKFSLSTQRMALDLLAQDARVTLKKKCARQSEADHMYAAITALRNTILWLEENEAEIKEYFKVQRELDAEAPR